MDAISILKIVITDITIAIAYNNLSAYSLDFLESINAAAKKLPPRIYTNNPFKIAYFELIQKDIMYINIYPHTINTILLSN
jgi:hypothetical protein